jgi:topoisomerase-4 subunit B
LSPCANGRGCNTDTTRPNHLVQEVVDKSVDEALAGYASRIEVILHADGSVTVADDGRGIGGWMRGRRGMQYSITYTRYGLSPSLQLPQYLVAS